MIFSIEQARVLDDTAVAYDGWIDALRRLGALGPIMQWRTNSGREYLYERLGGRWGRSRGPRSPETEAIIQHDTRERTALKREVEQRAARLDELAALYKALRLPRLDPRFGAITREADKRGLLDVSLMVVGTNAMAAYEIEAQRRFFSESMTTTQDCDFAWCRAAQMAVAGSTDGRHPIYSMLKAVDDTFTVNLERDYQARNAAGYEFELLMGPSVALTLPASEHLRPLRLPEQDWLLRGRRISHVVFDRSDDPVRLVVPDPRWMALHKLWLSDKPERNVNKVKKDHQQGALLAHAVATHMRRSFPVDDAFLEEVPEELHQYLRHFSVHGVA